MTRYIAAFFIAASLTASFLTIASPSLAVEDANSAYFDELRAAAAAGEPLYGGFDRVPTFASKPNVVIPQSDKEELFSGDTEAEKKDVVVQILVDEQGNALSNRVMILSTEAPTCSLAVVEATKQTTFEPLTLDRTPVKAYLYLLFEIGPDGDEISILRSNNHKTVKVERAERCRPFYPSKAKRRGTEGEVVIRLRVLPNGAVDTRDGMWEIVEMEEKVFEEAAVKAALNCKYKPPTIGDQPTEVEILHTVTFDL